MKKQQLLGLSRELLTAIGAALVAFGVQFPENGIGAIIGALMVIISLAWSLKANEGKEVAFTLVRKLFSAAGGVGVAFGLMTPEKLEALIAVVGPIIALTWSFNSKGGTLPPSVNAIILFLCLGFIASGTAGCGALGVTPDGCILQSFHKDGQTYKAGPCVDDFGKVNRARIQWENSEGMFIRATFYKDNLKAGPLVEYRAAEGVWVMWTSKSGIMIGPVPPGIYNAVAIPGNPIELDRIDDEQLRADLGELY